MEPLPDKFTHGALVYSQLRRVGERAVFTQIHKQGEVLCYEVLHLALQGTQADADHAPNLSLADAEALLRHLRQHVGDMCSPGQEDDTAPHP